MKERQRAKRVGVLKCERVEERSMQSERKERGSGDTVGGKEGSQNGGDDMSLAMGHRLYTFSDQRLKAGYGTRSLCNHDAPRDEQERTNRTGG